MMDFFHTNFMLQTPNESDNQPPSSLPSLLPSCSPHDFHVMNAPMLGKRSMSFSGIDAFNEEANGGCGGGGGGGEEDNLSDDGSQGGGGGEKKIRRLNTEQVKTLEKNFQLGNKLEPDRKVQLAKALGLQPRQVAIWFQNRRARWKTKQLEKEYEILKTQFEALKADNESLLAQNQKLQSEISALKGREPTESINLNKETDQGSCSNRSENSSDIKLDMSTTAAAAIDSPHPPLPSSRSFFPPSASSTFNRPNGAPAMTQFFQNPPIGRPDLHCQRFDQGVKEENYTNMFCGIDDHSGFWPWIEQPNFN